MSVVSVAPVRPRCFPLRRIACMSCLPIPRRCQFGCTSISAICSHSSAICPAMNPTGTESGVYAASSNPLRLKSLSSSMLLALAGPVIAPAWRSVSNAANSIARRVAKCSGCAGVMVTFMFGLSVRVVGVIFLWAKGWGERFGYKVTYVCDDHC